MSIGVAKLVGLPQLYPSSVWHDPHSQSAAAERSKGDRMQSLIDRLRMDFGRKTLGELIRDREAAAIEIGRLTHEIAKCRSAPAPKQAPRDARPARTPPVAVIGMDGRELLRLKDVCRIVGLSRSTIYGAMANRRFPRAVRIGVRAVRWRSSDVAAWLASKGPEND